MDGRRVRTEATWGEARDAYLAGMSAPEVCARFDVGLSAFRQRARSEGWRRADQADPDLAVPEAAADVEAELDALGAPDFEAMAERAARMAQRAVARGELTAADAWMRLHARLAPHASHARHVRSVEEREAARKAAKIAAKEARDLHAMHSVHPVSACTSDAPVTRDEVTKHGVTKDEVAKNGVTKDEVAEPAAPKRALNRADRRRQARAAAYRAHIAGRTAPAPADAAQGP